MHACPATYLVNCVGLQQESTTARSRREASESDVQPEWKVVGGCSVYFFATTYRIRGEISLSRERSLSLAVLTHRRKQETTGFASAASSPRILLIAPLRVTSQQVAHLRVMRLLSMT